MAKHKYLFNFLIVFLCDLTLFLAHWIVILLFNVFIFQNSFILMLQITSTIWTNKYNEWKNNWCVHDGPLNPCPCGRIFWASLKNILSCQKNQIHMAWKCSKNICWCGMEYALEIISYSLEPIHPLIIHLIIVHLFTVHPLTNYCTLVKIVGLQSLVLGNFEGEFRVCLLLSPCLSIKHYISNFHVLRHVSSIS
jgi:hypothetical protein